MEQEVEPGAGGGARARVGVEWRGKGLVALGTSDGIDVLDGVQAFAIGFADCARSLRSLAAWTPSACVDSRRASSNPHEGVPMTLEIYPVVLELVRQLAPSLPKLRACSSSSVIRWSTR